MIVTFKNQIETLHISDEIAKIIADRLTSSEGAKSMQVFRDENGEVILIININEILHIK